VLFVREGDDQKLIEPSPRDLAAGSYEYRPTGNDVTFRLEVTDKAGKVSAESFRLVRPSSVDAALAAKAPLPKAGAPASEAPVASPSSPAPLQSVQPKATYRAPPIVAAGIRPRIKGMIPIDVRVRIDERGRVVSATTITKLTDGLEKYLATRALQAARQWKFQPARENGKAVAGTQTIHFVFTK
jgi:TonB family protein